MDAAPRQGLYPLHRCKTIHLVRHAQGFHNVAGRKDHSAYMLPELFDAELTPLGWQQVDNLRKHVRSSGLSRRIELVVVSPLLRTMQTAVGVFGGDGYEDGIDVPPLMAENAGNSSRPAISSLNSPPFVAMELCREHLGVLEEYRNQSELICCIMQGVHWCDKRRSISEYKPLFPAIDFSLIESDDDTLWKLDVREANEDLGARGLKFFNWLSTRKETNIAVVTHSGFLIHTLAAFGDDCHPSVKNEICRPMLSSGSSTTDYPGKIPDGSDAPSEEVDKK
ncbi:UNVERIFIED_CONTAM: Phosphoglycerate mutase-like protein 2 [Sesamum angustifolium]|uniref:Phosphoglycerate mutase-like protein 2 n=1 Tax=Sesamum angustifolium TaxID=2727405 RepID=A0AAW2ISL6_9LAMI